MRTLANIIWHIPFLGFVSAFCVFLLGGALTLTIIAAPIGLGLIQYAKFLMVPFSHEMVSKSDLGQDENPLWKSFGIIVWIFYFPVGLILSIVTIIQIVCLFFTIVGIPLAIVLAKSLSTYFNPVGKVCVNRKVLNNIR